jgi:hypothetical protein
LHRLSSSFVLGFHGCDQSVADDLLNGKDFVPSANDWDWLGSGIYFWEAGFFEKTHIQICVREKSCIKGVFRVSDDYLTA